MKRGIVSAILMAVVMAWPLGAFAEDAFKSNAVVGQIGFGYGMKGTYGDVLVPPIFITADYGVQKDPKVPLSFGALFGYSRSEEKVSIGIPAFGVYTWKYSYEYYLLGGRAAYHFTPFIKVTGLDLYAGIMMGYAIVSSKVDSKPAGSTGYSSSAEGSYFLWGLFGGARYYITDRLGAFLEFGFGLGNIAGGVCYRF